MSTELAPQFTLSEGGGGRERRVWLHLPERNRRQILDQLALDFGSAESRIIVSTRTACRSAP